MTHNPMTPDALTPPADYPFEVEIDLTEPKYMDRLHTLQGDIAAGGFLQKDLRAVDLILLLQHDPWVQQLVGQIASQALRLPVVHAQRDAQLHTDTPLMGQDDAEGTNALPSSPKAEYARLQDGPARASVPARTLAPRPVAPPAARPAWSLTPPPPPEDTWRKELHEPLALLHCVRQDPELSARWLGADGQAESEPRQLLRVCVMAAQWDQVTQLAELLKTRCSQRQQAANANELALMRGALALYNLSAGTLQAGLQTPAVGDNFDPSRHNRANSQGASIAECLLPALLNRSKKVVQAALVLTR